MSEHNCRCQFCGCDNSYAEGRIAGLEEAAKIVDEDRQAEADKLNKRLGPGDRTYYEVHAAASVALQRVLVAIRAAKEKA